MDYNEIFRLKAKLESEQIPFEFIESFDGFRLCYPSVENRKCSVIEHKCSLGHEKDLLEIMGLLNEGESYLVGYLTAEDVFKRILDDYKK